MNQNAETPARKLNALYQNQRMHHQMRNLGADQRRIAIEQLSAHQGPFPRRTLCTKKITPEETPDAI